MVYPEKAPGQRHNVRLLRARSWSIAATVLFVVLSGASCSKYGPQSEPGAPTLDDAIQRVTSGLLPAVAEQGKPGRKASIPERMSHYGVPGLSVAVINEGEIAWERSFGVTEAGGGTPVTSHTLFQAASISKPVTAAGSLVFVQDGSISLDEDVNTWLESWKIPENDLTQSRSVTLRSLLSHTSGFVGNNGVNEYVPGAAVPTITQALNGEPPATNPPVRIANQVGTFAYSGSGYAVLQQLLVDVSGKPFAVFMQDTVLTPIEMNRSTFERDPAPANIAKGHHAGGEPVTHGYRTYSGEAAAGLWTTATDLAQFTLSIQSAAAGQSDSILTQKMANQMLTAQLSDCVRCWGFGFEILGDGTARWFTHDGINVGYDSKLIANVSTGDGAVVMTNGSLSFGLIHEILDSIAREYDWPDYPVKGQTESVPIPENALISFPGDYELEPGFNVTVVADNGRLFLQIPTQGRTELYASTPTSLFNTAIDWGPMTFVADESGQITHMMIGHPGQQSTHKRLR